MPVPLPRTRPEGARGGERGAGEQTRDAPARRARRARRRPLRAAAARARAADARHPRRRARPLGVRASSPS